MGPGILVKAVLQGSFSLMVFGWAQIVMDIQPLLVMLTGAGQLHGFSHTLIGATLLALFSMLSGKSLSELGLRILGISQPDNPIAISWRVATVSAFLGTYSHLLLDGFMHTDVAPFYPFSQANAWHGVVGIGDLHLFCLVSGIVGTVIFFAVPLATKYLTRNANDH
jgi:hypothetical protein